MEDGDQLVSLISVLYAMKLVTNLDVMTCTIFIWDYILTFRMEVELVWKSKWTFMKGLYFFQRYLPFIDTVFLLLYSQTAEGLTKTTCRNLFYLCGTLTMVGLAASEMILTLRTWAVWNRNQHLSITLPILYVLAWGSGFVLIGMFLNSIVFSDAPYPRFQGCFVTYSNNDIIFIWVVIIIWDTLILALMLVPAIRSYRSGGNSALAKSVYCDGINYYLFLFTLSFINILVIKVLPPEYRTVITSLARMVHSMLTSRVILHIRAQAGVDTVQSNGLRELNTSYNSG